MVGVKMRSFVAAGSSLRTRPKFSAIVMAPLDSQHREFRGSANINLAAGREHQPRLARVNRYDAAIRHEHARRGQSRWRCLRPCRRPPKCRCLQCVPPAPAALPARVRSLPSSGKSRPTSSAATRSAIKQERGHGPLDLERREHGDRLYYTAVNKIATSGTPPADALKQTHNRKCALPQLSRWRRMQIPVIAWAAYSAVRLLGPTLRLEVIGVHNAVQIRDGWRARESARSGTAAFFRQSGSGAIAESWC